MTIRRQDTGVEILAQAVSVVQGNLKAFAIYIAITVTGGSLLTTASYLTGGPAEPGTVTGASFAALLALEVVVAVLFSLAQCIAFARFAREMDYPIWRIGSDRDAVRLFFKPWIALNLLYLIPLVSASWAYEVLGNEDMAGSFSLLGLFATVVYIPIGACIMFFGAVERPSTAECLAPLTRQFPKTLVVLLLSAAVVFMCQLMFGLTRSQEWLHPLIFIIFGYFDCVIFTAVFLVCMLDRQAPEDIDSDFL